MDKKSNLKDILIIFTDFNLPYSPTTLNLYDTLSSKFNVSILTFEPYVKSSSVKIFDRNVNYIKIPNKKNGKPLYKRLFNEIKKSLKTNLHSSEKLITPSARALINTIKDFEGEIIAVDYFALWCVQFLKKTAHFLSLEIHKTDPYREACNTSSIKSVLIQSKERFEFLFTDQKIPVFFVQNAPIFNEIKIHPEQRKCNDLIFCGSALPIFGIFSCIEFIKNYPEYNLTIKGYIDPFVKKVILTLFNDLINDSKLILDEEYMSSENLQNYISNFFAGFVFYDIYRFESIHSFNYLTAPSGKLFQYYNSGVPVIGNRLLGLSSIEEFNAGVLINDLGSKSIAEALERIKRNYNRFVNGTKAAASHYDFKRNIQDFIHFITN